jgi:hypothetical protein
LTHLKQFLNARAKLKNGNYRNSFATTNKKEILRDYWDLEYLGSVGIGTPRQYFNGLLVFGLNLKILKIPVVMDTGRFDLFTLSGQLGFKHFFIIGSANFWIPDSVKQNNRLHPSKLNLGLQEKLVSMQTLQSGRGAVRSLQLL